MTGSSKFAKRPNRQRGSGIGRLLFIAFSVVLVIVAVNWFVWLGSTGGLESLSSDAIMKWIKSFGAAAVFASCVVMIVCALTFLPAEVPALANGMIYGPWVGGIVTWTGAMIGANIAYGLARLFGPALIDRWIGRDRAERFHKAIDANGTVVLLIARCIPLIPFFAVNYLAGAASMRLWTFNWVTGIGILPMTVALVTMGDQALKMPISMWLTLVIALIALILLVRSLLLRSSSKAELLATVSSPNTADKVDAAQ